MKHLVLGLVLLILGATAIIGILVISGMFTFFVSGVLSLSVNERIEGTITSFVIPESVAVGNPIPISVTFQNVGNVNYSSQIVVLVYDPQQILVAQLFDENVTLLIGASRTFVTSFTPTTTGDFLIVANVTFAGNRTEITNGTVRVNPVLAPPAAAPTPAFGVPTFSESKRFAKCVKDKPCIFKVQNSDILKFVEISFVPTVDLQNIDLIVREITSPGTLPPVIEKETNVLKYTEIAGVGFQNSQVAQANLIFKVEKFWIANSNIEKQTVTLFRLEGRNWQKLPTRLVFEDNEFVYYESESTALLSIFAIAGEKAVLRMDFDEFVKVSRGQTVFLNIFVKNVGKEDLNNLVFTAKSAYTSVTAAPSTLAQLPVGSSFVFLITVKVPRDISAGRYFIDFTIRSDKVTKDGRITLDVEVTGLEVEIRQSIENFRISIQNLQKEITQAFAEGRNVTEAQQAIDAAKSDLDIAEALADQRDYVGAKKKLDEVSRNIEKTAEELSKALRPPIIFVPVPFPRPEVVGLIGTGIGMSTFAYYRHKHEEEKIRKRLRQAVETIRHKHEIRE
jgi:PGF-pre-PGF domain-containing protein